MTGSNISPWPKDLLGFAFIPDFNDRLTDLANMAEKEDWDYQNTPTDYPRPILYNYIRYTYTCLAEQHKTTISEDAQECCFNTGLVTKNQEEIYACFDSNRISGNQRWHFEGWFRSGQWELNKFSDLPGLAHYFSDPTDLVFDANKEFRINIEHIISDTPRDRFPEPYASMSDYALQTHLEGAIQNAKKRVKRSYKTAIPQFYQGQIQLLLPLCLSEPQKADLALVIEKHETFYRATTCLTLDMAYNNARQLARPDRDWLQP